MRRQHVELEIGALDIQAGGVAHALQQRINQAAETEDLGRREFVGQPRRALGQRHEAAARLLRQALQKRLQLVLEHAGHQPFGARLAHLVEHEQRHAHREAVARVAGLVQVARGAVHAAQPHHLGKRAGGDAGGFVPHQLLAREAQQVGVGAAGLAPPLLEIAPVADALRDLQVVEGVDQLIVHQHVLAAALVLQLLDLGDGALVGGQERQAARPLVGPLATDQRFAQEQLARGVRVHRAKAPAPPAVDHQAVERGALQRHHVLRLLLPVRIEQLLLQKVPAHFFQPLRLDIGDAAAEQARGFHQLGADDPLARPLAQVRAGVAKELDAARAQVVAALPLALFQLAAHVAQQSGEQALVYGLVPRWLGVLFPLVFRHHGVQLGVDVAPFAHAADADEVLSQQIFPLPVAELVAGRGVRILSQIGLGSLCGGLIQLLLR